MPLEMATTFLRVLARTRGRKAEMTFIVPKRLISKLF
jgi:hypothetical protein